MEKYIILQGYYDCYAISNLGNVKNIRTNKVLNPSIRPDGYKSVLLSKDGIKQSIRVHQLVAMYFLKPVVGKTFVNHINGIKHDNRAENLEWCNHQENMLHASENNLIHKKYNNIYVYDYNTKELLFNFESVKQCSKFLNLKVEMIYRVLQGKQNHHKNFYFKSESRI